ncbi:MAG: hypothetical protein IKV15_01880 [Bacteroidaceae bacterium]|nr:hypothetical protein [Bacteroidaceae bacterium]
MKPTKRLILILFCCLSNMLWAQVDPVGGIRLYRTRSGHYAFHTLLNDRVLSSVMIESGIHAALIDSAFIHKHQHELGLTIRPNNMNKEINLGGTVYRITHRAKGSLKMSDCVYEGEFLVLSHYRNETEVTIPIQRLRQKNDWGSRIVMLDIKNNQMRMLTRNELQSWDCTRHKINHRSYMRMPAISTTITITTSESTLSLEGNFNIDLGNPMPLYLREQSLEVQRFLNENKTITLTAGYNQRGEVVAQAFKPFSCEILGHTLSLPTICVTDKLQRFTTDGLIGLPLFMEHAVAFDFDNDYLYIQE